VFRIILLNLLIKIGAELPDVNLFENNPGNKINTRELFKDKKGIIFGVPG
jgi:2-Cys peroxiredoxin 5